MAGERHLTDKRSAGTFIGQASTEKVGFYGTTPADQPATDSQAAVTATAVTATATTATITTAAHGFATGTHGDAVVSRVAQLQVDVAATVVLVNQMRTDLVELGIIKGEA